MTNWTSLATGTGARVTTRNYSGTRGFLTNKVYDGSSGPVYYTNTAAGRLKARKWARGAFTTYTTNGAGEIVGVTYSDNATPNVTFDLDRLGRTANIIDGTGTNFITYHDSCVVLWVTNQAGILASMSLTNGYDAFLRRVPMALRTNGRFHSDLRLWPCLAPHKRDGRKLFGLVYFYCQLSTDQPD
jgi:hypothetical protein